MTYLKQEPGLIDWRIRFAWSSWRQYVLNRWLLDWGWYGCCCHVKIFGLLIQAYRKSSILVKNYDGLEESYRLECQKRLEYESALEAIHKLLAPGEPYSWQRVYQNVRRLQESRLVHEPSNN